MNDIFEKNLRELLKNKSNQYLANKLKIVKSSDKYSITLSKNNRISLSYNGKALTSKYSPDDEAKRFIDSYIIEKYSSLKKLFGLFASISSYNHIDYFLQLNKLNKAIVIERDISLIRLILESYYFESLERVVFICDDNFENVSSMLDSAIKEREIISLLYIRHTRSSAIEKEYYDTIDKIYSNIAKEKILSLKTLYYFAPIWGRNIILNLIKNEANSANFFLSLLHNKTPLLLVSAGSSIDRVIDSIKKLSKTHFVLCLSHALNTLLENDIIPDAVITTDGGFYSYHHLFRMFEKKYAGIIKVITTHTSYSNTLFNIDKKNIHYFSHNESFENMIYKDSLYIPMEGSVVMPALRIAALMKPLYIIVAGADFCYVDYNTHSRCSFAAEYDFLTSNKLDSFESKKYRRQNITDNVLCYDGEYRLRSEALKSYFRHFSTLLKSFENNIKFYTLTKQSAKIEGVEIFDTTPINKLKDKNIEYKNLKEDYDKDNFLSKLNDFFDEVQNNNTDTMNSEIAYILAPFQVDNSSSFDEFKNSVMSFKKYTFDI